MPVRTLTGGSPARADGPGLDLSTPILQSLSEGLLIARDGIIVDVNPALCAMTGFSREELVGERLPSPLVTGESRQVRALCDRIAANRGVEGEVRLTRKSGKRLDAWVRACPVRGSDGTLVGSVAELRDITQAKRDEARLRRLAVSDPLTRLLNRRRFHEILGAEIARSQRHRRPVSLVLLDIDHFKNVNDRHGHPTGDRVLVEVARRLRRIVRDGEHLARVGGEEFGWILPDADARGAVAAAERARAAIKARPFAVIATLTLSAGVCELGAGFDAGALYSCADDALYAAKRAGRDATRLYEVT